MSTHMRHIHLIDKQGAVTITKYKHDKNKDLKKDIK